MKTLEKYADARRGNYCTLPSKDVEILPDIRLCESCGLEIRYEKAAPRDGLGSWRHVDSAAPSHGYVGPKTRCRYCHSQKAVYRQHAWYDAVECDRCGGVDGYAIGD